MTPENTCAHHICKHFLQPQVRLGVPKVKRKPLASFRISLKSDAQPSCGTPTPGNMRFHQIFLKCENFSKISFWNKIVIFRNRTDHPLTNRGGFQNIFLEL